MMRVQVFDRDFWERRADQVPNDTQAQLSLHPNMGDELWPNWTSPAGKFKRLVQTSIPTWVWVVYVQHVQDYTGGIYLGPVHSQALADDIATAVEGLRMPGLRRLSVERVDGHSVPLEFCDDADWRETVRCLQHASEVHRVAWLIDYLMRGGR